MANDDSQDYGSLVVSALLVLSIAFAGYWIYEYAQTGSPPWSLTGWFAGAAAVISVGGIAWYILRK